MRTEEIEEIIEGVGKLDQPEEERREIARKIISLYELPQVYQISKNEL